ncbi:MAG TPA: histidine kinase [Candidatus Sulfomarinibacteraceae bacterium]|nr:histidine kinase [Candidatus Sulfomarinibacteraceae bacterium]
MQSAIEAAGGWKSSRSGRFEVALVLLIWLLAVTSLVGKFVYLLPVRRYRSPAGLDILLQTPDLVEPAFVMLLLVFGSLIILRSSSHRYGWLMLAVGLSTTIVNATSEYAQYALVVAPEAGLPLGWAAAWVQDLWMLPFVLLFSLPFLFPDGRLPTARWRTIFRVQSATWGLYFLVFAFARRPLTNGFLVYETALTNPLGLIPMSPDLYNGAFAVLVGIYVVTGTGTLVTRWRGTRGDVRQQIKWVMYAFFLMLMALAASWVNILLVEAAGIDLGLSPILDVVISFSLLAVMGAMGLAVLRYRLYDIDLLINRTLVYGALTVMIVATYIFFVAGVGALLPLQDNLFLSLVATGVIAVLFAPMRARLQRAANRLMFGQRDDPYAVLSELGRLLATSATPQSTLHTVVETVARTLKLPYAAIQLEQDGAYDTRAEYGSAAAEKVALPLVHHNEVVGRLVIAPRSPGQTLAANDRRLLEDVAHQAAALAHNVRLTGALQRSRERLVAALEEERRRLRRDLHDGLGPSLASQTFKLDAALELLQQDPQAATGLLESLKKQNQRLVADIRRLVYQLRPPALDQLGLAGALRAYAGQIGGANGLQIAIAARPDPLPELGAAVEVAAYRIALEAVTNVVRHARAAHCTVTLEATQEQLRLIVADDGVGLGPQAAAGVGLTSMRERAEELGGSLTVAAAQPSGTRVMASLPADVILDNDSPPASEERKQVNA